jgi:hypothetical protein
MWRRDPKTAFAEMGIDGVQGISTAARRLPHRDLNEA